MQMVDMLCSLLFDRILDKIVRSGIFNITDGLLLFVSCRPQRMSIYIDGYQSLSGGLGSVTAHVNYNDASQP